MKYKISQDLLEDLKLFKLLPIEKPGVFIKNSVSHLLNSEMQTPEHITEQSIVRLCSDIIKIITEASIDYRVSTLPSYLSFTEANDDIDNNVEASAVVMYSVKCTLNDIKSFCKFLYGKKCLVLYQAFVTKTCNTDEFILRLGLLTKHLIPEFAEFEDGEIDKNDKFKI